MFSILSIGLLLSLGSAPAQTDRVWVNQQGARLSIGQESFTRSDPTSSRDVLGSAGGVAVGGGKLIVADGNRIGATPINNRVLIYDNLEDFILAPEALLPQGSTCPACVGRPDHVLGQPDFETFDSSSGQGSMHAPSGVATDGQVLAVADSNNNRVLIWRSIPSSSSVPADVVIGQPDFDDRLARTTATGMRGPQGLWIDSGKLFVADTQNSRILIWNSIPSSNGQGADLVVGQPDFDTRPEPDLTQSDYTPNSQRLLDPVSVSVNNGRMFVADLGFDRVLVYFSIPTSSGVPADVVIGQADFESSGFRDHDDDFTTPSIRANVLDLCEQIGPFDDDGSITPSDNIFPPSITRCVTDPGDDPLTTDDDVITCLDDLETPRWPRRCDSTLNFPRFALSDGERLFIADSGNDRILVYDQIPQQNGARADSVIGQPDFIALTESDGPGNVRAPTSLAHDGTNLYVADPFSRRILVFTPGDDMIAQEGIRNGAAFDIKATAFAEWEGSTEEDQLATVTVATEEYQFRTEPGWTAEDVRDQFVQMINDNPAPLVAARPSNGLGTFAVARVTFGGSVRGGDRIVLHVGDLSFEATTQDGDVDPFIVVDRLLFVAADGHPDVFIQKDDFEIETLLVTGRTAGTSGNGIPVSVEIPAGSPLTVEITDGDNVITETVGGSFPARAILTAVQGGRPGNAVGITNVIGGAGILASISGGRLSGGSDARQLTPGAFTAMFGEGFSEQVLEASLENGALPTELGGVRVYVNGLEAPIYAITPNQVNFQVPWEIVSDPGVNNSGISTYVRREMPDGSVMVSAARANPIVTAAPGLFASGAVEPRRAVAVHATGTATGQVAIGAPRLSDEGTIDDLSGVTEPPLRITIRVSGREYFYDVVTGDSPTSIRDQLIESINAGNGDPDVVASPGQAGFFSARANVNLSGEPAAGDIVTLRVRDREYAYVVQEGDSLEVIRNVLVQTINSGSGDVEVTARVLPVFGTVILQLVARELGVSGNDITFAVEVSSGAGLVAETSDAVAEAGTLLGGQTPPAVVLTARADGRQGNDIAYSASSSDATVVTATARQATLCCGNVPFSLITDENPAVPGENIIVFGAGLGFTAPLPESVGLRSGMPTPSDQLFSVPFDADDFVSSLAGGRTAQLQFAGLMPGFVGIYQINLRLNDLLPDDPNTLLDIRQVLFLSNPVGIPVKNLTPRDP